MWSPITDSDEARLVIFDDRGSEFFAVIPHRVPGKSYRERRAAALAEIAIAIDQGYQPGQVPIHG